MEMGLSWFLRSRQRFPGNLRWEFITGNVLKSDEDFPTKQGTLGRGSLLEKLG